MVSYRWNYASALPEGPQRARFDSFLENIDWKRLLDCATTARQGVTCKLLPDIGLGYNHMVRVIEFQDSIRWVARLRMPSLDGPPYPLGTVQAIESEKSAAVLVQKHTDVPVPSIHAIETNENCSVGAPFMLMDCLDGNVGMDLGMKIPRAHKPAFYSKLARLHVAIARVQLPKIGTILSINNDGTCMQGPIPGIGGPFDTASEYFRAWSATAQFPLPEERLRAASGSFASEIVPAVASFPRSVQQVADRISVHDNGPFPLSHGDFGHNNIVVSDDYEVLGVIDWENAFAAPWEVAGKLPLTLSTTPQAMDAPWNYDEKGHPKDSELAEQFFDQALYIRAVEEEEIRLGIEENRSIARILKDKKRQDLIAAMGLFENGKAGFYSRIIEQFNSQ